jgi:hypothetical protein
MVHAGANPPVPHIQARLGEAARESGNVTTRRYEDPYEDPTMGVDGIRSFLCNGVYLLSV